MDRVRSLQERWEDLDHVLEVRTKLLWQLKTMREKIKQLQQIAARQDVAARLVCKLNALEHVLRQLQ